MVLKSISRVLSLLACGLLGSGAEAQEPPPTNAPVTPTVPQQTQKTEVIPRAPLPAPALPAAPEAAPTRDQGGLARATAAVAEHVRIYGILRPLVSFAGAAVESFGNANASAPSAAANPALANLPDESRLSFQVAQSRFGLWIGENSSVRGHLEFDFIDFARSSPTVQSVIRLRIASVEWSPMERLTLIAGQDWDLWAPINPHGMNLVGGHFQSGNTGFMRNQLKALWTLGENVEVAAAIGLQGPNAANRDAAIELGRMPTFALRGTALLGKLGRLGIDGIATRLRITPGANERHALAGAAGVFGELMPYALLQLRFEGYVARNFANTGALALSQATRRDDIDELGGYVSARHGFLGRHAVYASYGTARTLNGQDVAPSYSYGTVAAGVTPALGTAQSAGTGPGMRWNQQARLGYDFKPLKALAIAVEGFWYKTRHQLLAIDTSRLDATRRAFGADVGMIYTF
jgi:hypothetical protein